jgi:hypothetical protein
VIQKILGSFNKVLSTFSNRQSNGDKQIGEKMPLVLAKHNSIPNPAVQQSGAHHQRVNSPDITRRDIRQTVLRYIHD